LIVKIVTFHKDYLVQIIAETSAVKHFGRINACGLWCGKVHDSGNRDLHGSMDFFNFGHFVLGSNEKQERFFFQVKPGST